jgi:hypothetical protein
MSAREQAETPVYMGFSEGLTDGVQRQTNKR